MPGVQQLEPAIIGEVRPVPRTEASPTEGSSEAQVDEPTPIPTDPPSQPEPEPVVSQAPPEAGSAEGIICSIWGRSLPCSYVLRVAACESGPDYYDDWADGG